MWGHRPICVQTVVSRQEPPNQTQNYNPTTDFFKFLRRAEIWGPKLWVSGQRKPQIRDPLVKKGSFLECLPKTMLKKRFKCFFVFCILFGIALLVASVDKIGIPKIVLSPQKEYYTLSKIACFSNIAQNDLVMRQICKPWVLLRHFWHPMQRILLLAS